MSNKKQLTDELIIKLKGIRETSFILQNTLDTIPRSAEITLAKRALEKAAMFTGLNIGLLSGKNPYAANNVKFDDVIADLYESTSETLLFPAEADTTVGQIKFIRHFLSSRSREISMSSLVETLQLKGDEEADFIVNSIAVVQGFTYARQILGMELQRIKKVRDLRRNTIHDGDSI